MPVEIRELVVRANVNRSTDNQAPSQEISTVQLKRLKREIIEACREELLELLEARLRR